MLDNNDIRSGLIGWLQNNSQIVGVLVSGSSSAQEIRERNWQGEDYQYPNIRVTCNSVPNQCGYSDVNATVSFFSEQKSSKQSLIGQGIVAKQMHQKSVSYGSINFGNMRVTSLPDAVQENGVWKSDVLLSTRAYGVASLEYYQRVRNMYPISYWPLYDPVGSSIAEDVMLLGDGTPSNVTFGVAGIGDGKTAGSFNGSTSHVDVYSSALNSAFNHDELTMSVWGKVSGVGVWTDAVERYLFKLGAGLQNRVGLYKDSASNKLSAWYYGGAVGSFIGFTSFSSLNWFHFAITVSKANDQFIGYLNGVASSPTTTLPTWIGNLSSVECMIGAYQSGSNVFSGSLAHVAVWDRVLTPSEILELAVL